MPTRFVRSSPARNAVQFPGLGIRPRLCNEREGWDCADECKMSPGKGTSRKSWRKPPVPGKDTGKVFDESRYDVGWDARVL